MGPDATALGQVFWYTLQGHHPGTGKPAPGWDPQELRSIQDYYVKHALTAVPGVAQLASIGGYVKEFQVDVDPEALQAYNITLAKVMQAVSESNLDVGARTLELNQAEYVVRGLGYLQNPQELAQSVVALRQNTPVRLSDIAHITTGPAPRRGGLDIGGAEAVGGVVVARYGANPLKVINAVKTKIKDISAGLPQKTLADGSPSRVRIVPFYDRSGLIYETLGTLEAALTHEVLISILVVLVLVFNLRASLLISSILPLAVLITFILMRYAGVDANVVALSGIAIAIGVMVDVGIIFTENIVRHKEEAPPGEARGAGLLALITKATQEVAPAVLTALATTIVSFIPVFTLQAAEGKLFQPLAFTKTFSVLAALFAGLVLLPTLAYFLFSLRFRKRRIRRATGLLLFFLGLYMAVSFGSLSAGVLAALGAVIFSQPFLDNLRPRLANYLQIILALSLVTYWLTREWMPLGVQNSLAVNFIFVILVTGSILGALYSIVKFYPQILRWCLRHKKRFLALPLLTLLLALFIWQGFGRIAQPVATVIGYSGWTIEETAAWRQISRLFPGMGSEFMPTLNEGSFLLMPSNMPHAGIEYNVHTIRKLDKKVESIPEVDLAVGKWGRVESALDPAPAGMFENIIQYKPEYILNEEGRRRRFAVNDSGHFKLQNGSTYNPADNKPHTVAEAQLIPHPNGNYFRQWRHHIHSPDDIWEEISVQSKFPGLTTAPRLQPIETRLLMLQTGMRAPLGLKVFGPDLPTIEQAAFSLEKALKKAPGIAPASVYADRVVGKPYLEIKVNRAALARYGLTVQQVQQHLRAAIGGQAVTTTLQGRERYAVRVRYPRDYRNSPEKLREIQVPTAQGAAVPLGQLTDITYRKGPQSIKSEDTFLMSYLIFDKKEGVSEGEAVKNARRYLENLREEGSLKLPSGVHYQFAGNFENQQRAQQTLLLVIPLSLLIIFLILYFQFRSVPTTLMIFSGVFVAFSGAFIMLWLYGQPWFFNFELAGISQRNLFQMGTVNLSVAVWVGFIALFGIATDDGVIMGTYLQQAFRQKSPRSITQVQKAVVQAGSRRVRPAMMTAATAVIALLPVLSSTGKGSEIMVPMAIPTFGGMLLQVMTMFVVPVLYSVWQENKIKKTQKENNL